MSKLRSPSYTSVTAGLIIHQRSAHDITHHTCLPLLLAYTTTMLMHAQEIITFTRQPHHPSCCLSSTAQKLSYVAAQYGLWRPFMASLTCNTRITSADHFQDTRHLEFDLTGSGIHYAPGDLLTIFPCQSPAAVSAFLQRMNLDPDAWVRIESAEIPPGSTVSSIQVCAAVSYAWQTCEMWCA